MNDDIESVKQQVLSIQSTMEKVKDLFAGIEEVNKKITVAQKELGNNLKEKISDEMAIFHTEMDRQSRRLNESITNILESKETVLHKDQELMMALETLLKDDQKQRKAREVKNFRLIVIVLILFIALCVGEKCINSTESLMEYKTNDTTSQSGAIPYNEMSLGKTLSTFDSTITNIQSNFPHEDDRFWSSIFAPIHRIIQEEYPSRPAVILIATTRSYSATAESLSRDVALLIETVYNKNDNSDTYLTLEANELNSLNPSEAKLQMDHALGDNYKRRHMVAVIHDIGSLPATSVTLLPAYCHRESAHFKKAVLLATVYMENGITFSADDVEAHLFGQWQELEEDISKPIISIITNNIAIMENKWINDQVCKTYRWDIHSTSLYWYTRDE